MGGTIEKQSPENVIRKTQDLVKEVIHPWPTIQEDPTPWSDDARFAKAFPFSFPMGTGDYRQPRLRSDFNALDWTQHVFRFYTGHMQSSMRGHRVLWAAFNMSLGDIASGKGKLVHKNSDASALTKADLKRLVTGREDLV